MMTKRYCLEDYKDFTRITLRLYDNKIEHKHYDWLTDCNKIVDLLNEQDERIQQLEESLGFCRDLLDRTCNSVRMKHLHKILQEMVTND